MTGDDGRSALREAQGPHMGTSSHWKLLSIGNFFPFETSFLWELLSIGDFFPLGILSFGTLIPLGIFSFGNSFLWDPLSFMNLFPLGIISTGNLIPLGILPFGNYFHWEPPSIRNSFLWELLSFGTLLPLGPSFLWDPLSLGNSFLWDPLSTEILFPFGASAILSSPPNSPRDCAVAELPWAPSQCGGIPFLHPNKLKNRLPLLLCASTLALGEFPSPAKCPGEKSSSRGSASCPPAHTWHPTPSCATPSPCQPLFLGSPGFFPLVNNLAQILLHWGLCPLLLCPPKSLRT